MCKNPIKVKNPRLKAGTFIKGVDKEFLVVPCGHCEECNSQRTKDLEFRAYYEYLRTKSLSGFTIFNTFTYSEENIPRSGGFGFFCKRDLQLFLKRLRKRLSDDMYNVDGNLRYLITSEYGEERNRPHYHPLFFVTIPNITPQEFDAYCTDCWHNLGTPYTNETVIGFTDRKDVALRVVNSIHGIKYICKYIFKGCEVVKAIKEQPWTDFSHFVYDMCSNSKGKLLWKTLKDYQLPKIWHSYICSRPELSFLQLMPFYLQSKGLGMSFLEECCYEDLFELVKVENRSPIGYAEYAVPSYYIRKVFYRYDKKSKRFILNELGKDYKLKTNQNMYDDYQMLLSSNKSLINEIFTRLTTYKMSFDDYLMQCLKGRTVDSFVRYCLYLKDRQISPMHKWLIPDDTRDLLKTIVEFTDIVSNDSIQQLIDDEPMWLYTTPITLCEDGSVMNYNDKHYVGSEPLYNSLPCFEGYDQLYNLMLKIKSVFNEAKCEKIRKDIEKTKNEKLAKAAITPYNAVYY